MALLDAHLEQISICAASIAELPFPSSKIFTNALLQPHDITTLIRDTEVHERALFSVPPPPSHPKAQDPIANSNRRNTVFNINGAGNSTLGGGASATRAPRRNTAVAAVLGNDLVERIRRGGGGGAGTGIGYRGFDGHNRNELDVDALLEGAEKLLNVYPIAGGREKIASMGERHKRLTASIEHYEYRIAEQQAELARVNRSRDEFTDEGENDAEAEPEAPSYQALTEEDWKREEEEVRLLEEKQRGLQDRVTSMGRDISGVLR